MSAAALYPRHHPGDDLLLAYACGSLGPEWSLIIASHLALCSECRHTVAMMEALGGAMLETSAADEGEAPCAIAAPGANALAQVFSRIDCAPEAPPPPPDRMAKTPVFPKPLRDLIGDLDDVRWRSLGGGARHALVCGGHGRPTARLLWIPPGAATPAHSHGGSELTLVLDGSFRDEDAVFRRGDFEEADATVTHQPLAGRDRPCVCLAVTDAPLRFSSLPVRLAQIFLKI